MSTILQKLFEALGLGSRVSLRSGQRYGKQATAEFIATCASGLERFYSVYADLGYEPDSIHVGPFWRSVTGDRLGRFQGLPIFISDKIKDDRVMISGRKQPQAIVGPEVDMAQVNQRPMPGIFGPR